VHVADVIAYNIVWMSCGIIEELGEGLGCGWDVALLPLDCLQEMGSRATSMVESVARPWKRSVPTTS
jgi:hypothetical protein